GFIEVVKDVMPNAEHMQCARHIYKNFRKQYPGLEYRKLFCVASKASYPQLFNKIMDKIKSCEAIENGFSECFDSIVNVRHKPLLTMLFWHVIPAGRNIFEVRSGSEGFIVDEGKRTCSCRMWQLSGLPCVYATKVIFLINRVHESYVPAWIEIDKYFVAYHNYVKPVPSMNFWPNQSMYSTILPLKPKKMPGRPRKKRIRAICEGGSSTSKVGSQGSCSNYKKPRDKKSSWKELVVEQTPKPKRVVGRPRKKQPVDDFKDVDVVQRGSVRDEGVCGTRGCAIGSRDRGGRGGVVGSRGDASGSIGRGAGGSGGASGLRGRGDRGSRGRGAGGSKRKPVSNAKTQKRQCKKKVGTYGFAKW
ncbi:multidrug resistance-associated protein 5, partial [Tanacetum coccineum]